MLAELGSLLVEFTRLAQLTKENKYYDAVARITDELEKLQSNTSLPGLWPLHVDVSGCKYQDKGKEDFSTETKPDGSRRRPTEPNGQKQGSTHDVRSGLHVDAEPANYESLSQNPNPISSLSDDCEEQGITPVPFATKDEFGLGALADSTYEYLPKEYMLLGGLKEQYRTMYEQAMDATRKYLLFRPMTKDNRDILFVAKASVPNLQFTEDVERLQYEYEGTHLACFTGGMFGIGARLFGISGDMDIAKKLTDGCIWAYESTTTGIMPESFEVLPCKQQDSCVWDEGRYNKTLDPYAEARIQRAESAYQKKLELAEIRNRISESPPPLSTPTSTDTHFIKRQEPLDDQTAEESELVVEVSEDTYGKSNKAYQTSQQGSLQVSEEDEYTPTIPGFPRPTILSHDEYVESRIKKERLPSGFIGISGYKYILRPEAIESVFIMFRLTGDNYWRERGWEMFQAIDLHTRTSLAHSAINDVTSESPLHTDSMESFWLAETLKYSYLLFSDPNIISLDEYVLLVSFDILYGTIS